MIFNRKQFFDDVRVILKANELVLSQSRTNALEFLLSQFETVKVWKDVRCVAYALATISIESAWTFEPIQEFGGAAYFERRYGSHTKKGQELGNDAPGEGAKYSGKGYVQLTGESNYEKLEILMRKQYPDLIAEYENRTGEHFDLTDFAYQAKDRHLAFAIMTIGMFQGIYTTKKFSDYITKNNVQYFNCRRIINGKDRATEIATLARSFEKTLRKSSILGAEPISEEVEQTNSGKPNLKTQSSALRPASEQSTNSIQTVSSSNQDAIETGSNDTPTQSSENQPSALEGENNPEPSVQISSETETEKKQTPEGESTKETSNTSITTETVSQYLPQITSAKRWLAGLSFAGALSTIGAKMAAMPDWLIFLAGVLTGIAFSALIGLIVFYHRAIFKLVVDVVRNNQNPLTNNINLVSEKLSPNKA